VEFLGQALVGLADPALEQLVERHGRVAGTHVCHDNYR
jgi:hypothetical protein